MKLFEMRNALTLIYIDKMPRFTNLYNAKLATYKLHNDEDFLDEIICNGNNF